MRNLRKVTLPPHCGSCIFNDWCEDGCHCLHPSTVDLDEIASESAKCRCVKYVCEEAAAEGLLDDSDLTIEYDQVCDNYVADSDPRGYAQLIAEAKEAFVNRLRAILFGPGEHDA